MLQLLAVVTEAAHQHFRGKYLGCVRHLASVTGTSLKCRGIAPLRAALEWTPVQAHATAHKVNLFYAAKSATSAAYLKDW